MATHLVGGRHREYVRESVRMPQPPQQLRAAERAEQPRDENDDEHGVTGVSVENVVRGGDGGEWKFPANGRLFHVSEHEGDYNE